MDHKEQPHVEDLLPVRSRISWAAIFAGAIMTIAVYLVLTVLGGAIGLSLSDANLRSSTLGIGAVIWSVLTLALSLFAGGYVTTQTAVGENKTEAAIHGVLMWGVVLGAMFWMMAFGVRTGYSAVMGTAYLARASELDTANTDWETVARRAGIPQERINEWRRQANEAPERAGREAADPETRQAALDVTTRAAWWTLCGMALSIAAAVAGAMAGSGPALGLFFLRGRAIMINRSELARR